MGELHTLRCTPHSIPCLGLSKLSPLELFDVNETDGVVLQRLFHRVKPANGARG
jgi:hypothetical protein